MGSDKPYYRSALWEATWKNNDAIVKILLENNASVDFADYQGRTPLHEAAYYGHINLVELFLEKGHPINTKDNFGQTALFRAAEAGHDDIVQLLVEKNKDKDGNYAQTNFLDSDGVTAQHMAAFKGMPDMATWLLYKGAYKNRVEMAEPGVPIEDRSTTAKELMPRPDEDDASPKAAPPASAPTEGAQEADGGDALPKEADGGGAGAAAPSGAKR